MGYIYVAVNVVVNVTVNVAVNVTVNVAVNVTINFTLNSANHRVYKYLNDYKPKHFRLFRIYTMGVTYNIRCRKCGYTFAPETNIK